MKPLTILRVEAEDRRFDLEEGAGTDAVHKIAQYAFAVTHLVTDSSLSGSGIVLTLGNGNEIVCQLILALAELLPKVPIEELMADFGAVSRKLSDSPNLRWLGRTKAPFISRSLPLPTLVSIYGPNRAACRSGNCSSISLRAKS